MRASSTVTVCFVVITVSHAFYRPPGFRNQQWGRGPRSDHVHVSPGIGVNHVDVEIQQIPHGDHVHTVAKAVPHVYTGELPHGGQGSGLGHHGPSPRHGMARPDIGLDLGFGRRRFGFDGPGSRLGFNGFGSAFGRRRPMFGGGGFPFGRRGTRFHGHGHGFGGSGDIHGGHMDTHGHGFVGSGDMHGGHMDTHGHGLNGPSRRHGGHIDTHGHGSDRPRRRHRDHNDTHGHGSDGHGSRHRHDHSVRRDRHRHSTSGFVRTGPGIFQHRRTSLN